MGRNGWPARRKNEIGFRCPAPIGAGLFAIDSTLSNLRKMSFRAGSERSPRQVRCRRVGRKWHYLSVFIENFSRRDTSGATA